MMDEDPAFDFGSWCVVCGRLVEPPLSATTTNHSSGQATASTSASSSPAHSPALSTNTTTTKAKRAGSIKRTKSGTKLQGHTRTRSGARLNLLGPSTQIHKGKDKALAAGQGKGGEQQGDHAGDQGGIPHADTATPPAFAEQQGEELSSLYCSLECQHQDQAHPPSPLQRPADPRRLSSSSSTHSNTPYTVASSSPRSAWSPSASPALPHSSEGMPGGLDFSTRRNSRGATYRPLAMTRTLSNDGGGGVPPSWTASRGSSTSLAGMADEDPRPHSHERPFARPLSSLSALRGMTPIPSPSHSSAHLSSFPSSSAPPTLRPSGGRSKSDMPRSSSSSTHGARFAEEEDGIRRGREETPEEREVRKREKRERSRVRREKRDGGTDGSRAPSVGRAGRGSSMGMAQSVPASLVMGLEELHLTATRPSGPSPIPSRTPNRSSSSASLALMGSSFSKSYGASTGQSFDSRLTSRMLAPQPTRSESTASLSGLNAMGTILPSGGELSSPSTFVAPQPQRPPLYSPTHPRSSLSIPPLLGETSSSPSSTTSPSSFTNSHQSHSDAQSHSTSHSSRSYLSSSAGSGSGSAGQRERGRTTRGLQMTPSSSSLAADGRSSSRTRGEKGRSSKAPLHPPPTPNRATSTPAGVGGGRPSIQHTAPTPSPNPGRSHRLSTSPTATRPSALQTPALSYLTGAAGGGGGGGEKPLARNFSWDNLGVKAYHSLDLDEVRAARAEGGGVEGAGGEKPQARQKKKLFHFAMDDEE